MKKKVPTGVMVIAIFHFIFSACGLLGALSQGSGLAKQMQQMQGAGDAKQDKLQKGIENVLENQVPGWKAVEMGGTIVGAIFSILLLACGIGLLSLQPWARLGSLAYAILSILYAIFILVFWLLVVNAPLNAGIREVAAQNGFPENDPLVQGMQIGMMAAGPIGACCGMVYPIAVLIVMLLPSISKAFRPGDLPPPAYGEGTDDFGGFERERPQ